MKPSVSVVIPTIGRPSLQRAVRSALDQTNPASEVIVVADTDDMLRLPPDERIIVLKTTFRGSPGRARQTGIDAARGSVIALLDDDDEWHKSKVERQLQAVGAEKDDRWVVSARMNVLGPGARQRVWPRRLITPGQSVAEYLFRLSGLRLGGAELQSSTLCFPTSLARAIRWDSQSDDAHDEASWLIRVQRKFPDVSVIQLPDVLSTYYVDDSSVSRPKWDRTDHYIEWGLRYLGDESPRVLGDYLCTSPVSAAVSASSLRGVSHSLLTAFRHARPGPFAVAYAVLNGARVAVKSATPQGHR
jgi:glycosyltransferase involved in cell wall biosynthesis